MKQTKIEHLLPGIFQRTIVEGTPLFALLQAMEALLAPDEAILNQLDTFFDPYHAPDAFIPFLASWVDLEKLLPEVPAGQAPLPSGMGQLRELVAVATYLSQWRGTAKGLLRFLETATGIQGFVIEEQILGPDGRLRPFHMRIHAPEEATQYRVLIEHIIELEKPAYVTYELTLRKLERNR